ncbi:hypothetical protein A9977_07855 [Variovorax sp. UMC13]|nr:hypothetical protein [Variovorax sp. UMC13]
MVSQHIKGRRPMNLAAATAYAAGFGVSLAEISPRLAAEVEATKALQRQSRSHEVDLDNHPDLERIRRVTLRLEAGVNGFAVQSEENDGMPIFFRSDWLRQRGYKPYQLVAIKVMGHSMEPTLYPDDMVVINTADSEPKDGKVFAVNYEGQAVIKRLVRDGGTWWLSSDNPDQRRYPRKECASSACLIVGQVIHKQSEQI